MTSRETSPNVVYVTSLLKSLLLVRVPDKIKYYVCGRVTRPSHELFFVARSVKLGRAEGVGAYDQNRTRVE